MVSSRGYGITIYAFVYLAFLYLPIFFLPLFSFNDGVIVAFPIKGFSTRWYSQLMTIDAMQDALWNSLRVAVSTSVLATILGVFGARAFTRYRFPGRAPLTSFVMVPLVLPEIIVAISLLIVLVKSGIGLSLVSVTLGHVLLCMPFAMAVLISSFEGLDQSLEEASFDLGESAAWTFWRVILPIVTPGIIASVLITFTISLDEFIVAFFLAGTDPTLPVYIWSQLRFAARLPSVLALGSIMLFASFVLLWLAEMLRRKSQARSGRSGGII